MILQLSEGKTQIDVTAQKDGQSLHIQVSEIVGKKIHPETGVDLAVYGKSVHMIARDAKTLESLIYGLQAALDHHSQSPEPFTLSFRMP